MPSQNQSDRFDSASRLVLSQAFAVSLLVHQLRAENLGLWRTRGEQPKHCLS